MGNERTSIEQKVVNWFRNRGDMVVKNTIHRRRGWPDITVYLDTAEVLFWEFKVPSNKLSEPQQRTKEDLETKGHTVFVAHSKEEAVEQYTQWLSDLNDAA